MVVPCPLCASAPLSTLLVEDRYAECKQCALRYLLPQYLLPESEEKERYLLHEHPAEDPGYEKYLSPLFEKLCKTLDPSSRGLDYGSGPASRIGKMLKTQSFEVLSYDPYFFPDTQVLEDQYDFVVAAEVVEHFYKPQHDFGLFRKLVAPNGVLGIMTQLYDGVDFDKWYYRRDPVHVSFYSTRTFEWIQKNHGWVRLEIERPKTILLRRAS